MTGLKVFMNNSKNNLLYSSYLTLAFLFTSTVIGYSQITISINESNSPYYIASDLVINSNDSLLIGVGAEVIISDNVNIDVYGFISIQGSESNPAKLIAVNPMVGWGQIIIHEEVEVFTINNTRIEEGRVLSFDCSVHFANVTFINNQPLAWDHAISRFHYGQLTIEDCQIIGTNQGEGFLCHDILNPIVINCQFESIPDAVEYLNCESGRIGNCTFRDIYDDAIDLNHCNNTVIDSNFIYNVTDRGMEIGSENNGSSTNILVRHNTIVNCGEGINFKEGSNGLVQNNTLYNNTIGITSLNGTPSSLGSSIEVINCILSQNVTPVFIDVFSTMNVSYSLSDNSILIGEENYTTQPHFISPLLFDFQLQDSSPCIDAGSPHSVTDPDFSRSDLGATYKHFEIEESLKIWPNPVENQVFILMSKPFKKFEVIDGFGKIYRTFDLTGLIAFQTNLEFLSQGIYFLAFYTNQEKVLVKIIKT
ncbi:MAG: hypothetical protein ACJA1C_003077 [Crocinitomicaceae bacterium]|jgi:hypothetical protein